MPKLPPLAYGKIYYSTATCEAVRLIDTHLRTWCRYDTPEGIEIRISDPRTASKLPTRACGLLALTTTAPMPPEHSLDMLRNAADPLLYYPVDSAEAERRVDDLRYELRHTDLAITVANPNDLIPLDGMLTLKKKLSATPAQRAEERITAIERLLEDLAPTVDADYESLHGDQGIARRMVAELIQSLEARVAHLEARLAKEER